MFGLVRLVILCAVAFVTGVLYERYNVTQVCAALNGQSNKGLCVVEDMPN